MRLLNGTQAGEGLMLPPQGIETSALVPERGPTGHESRGMLIDGFPIDKHWFSPFPRLRCRCDNVGRWPQADLEGAWVKRFRIGRPSA